MQARPPKQDSPYRRTSLHVLKWSPNLIITKKETKAAPQSPQTFGNPMVKSKNSQTRMQGQESARTEKCSARLGSDAGYHSSLQGSWQLQMPQKRVKDSQTKHGKQNIRPIPWKRLESSTACNSRGWSCSIAISRSVHKRYSHPGWPCVGKESILDMLFLVVFERPFHKNSRTEITGIFARFLPIDHKALAAQLLPTKSLI